MGVRRILCRGGTTPKKVPHKDKKAPQVPDRKNSKKAPTWIIFFTNSHFHGGESLLIHHN